MMIRFGHAQAAAGDSKVPEARFVEHLNFVVACAGKFGGSAVLRMPCPLFRLVIRVPAKISSLLTTPYV